MVERFGTMGIYVHFSAYDEVAAELYRVRNAIVTITAERDDCEASARGASLAYGEQRERATAAEAKLAKVEAAIARLWPNCFGPKNIDELVAFVEEERLAEAEVRSGLSAELAEARAEIGKAIKQGFDRCADIAAERDRYKAGLQTLSTTFYKEDQHQDYAKHVLSSKEVSR